MSLDQPSIQKDEWSGQSTEPLSLLCIRNPTLGPWRSRAETIQSHIVRVAREMQQLLFHNLLNLRGIS